jgi:CRISPR-associated helicase Cas3/CRISPR-associated endonuclease Cas3-HD
MKYNNIISHRYDSRDKLLIEHSSEVFDGTSESIPDGLKDLNKIAKAASFSHDAAKATEEFQNYIRSDEIKSTHNHARFGSIVCYYLLSKYDISKENRLVGLYIVMKHHSRLDKYQNKQGNLSEIINNSINPQDIEEIRKKIVKDEDSIDCVDKLLKRVNEKASWEELNNKIKDGSIFKDIKSDCTSSVESIVPDTSEDLISNETYIKILFLWSSFCYNDKKSASQIPDNYFGPKSNFYPLDMVESYINNLEVEINNELDAYRNMANLDVYNNAVEYTKSSSNVCAISLPTGIGKTLSGTRAALKILEEKDGRGSLVYCLPFTSIIDQVTEEYSKIFNCNIKDRELTVHNYLSDTLVKMDEIDESNTTNKFTREEKMLGESWQSNIILTTFVQLFESLLAPGNMQSTKIPSLENSVILLDEPQSLPYQWWGVVRYLCNQLIDKYNVDIVSMTATQPYIFERSDSFDVMELCSEPEKLFNMDKLKRVEYNFWDSFHQDDTSTSIDELSNKIISKNGSRGIIMNTIDSCRELTKKIKDRTDATTLNELYFNHIGNREKIIKESQKSDTLLCHITSRHRPIDRENLIEIVNELLEKNTNLIMTSTQVIEAGVDISFDYMFRDIAPLDRIVQAAGRCNRNLENKVGKVEVFQVEYDGGTPSDIYEIRKMSLLDITKEVIPKREDYIEMKWNYIEEYYNKISKRLPKKDEKVKALENCKLNQISEMSLIDSQSKSDILVPYGENEIKQLKKARKNFSNKNFEKAYNIIDSFKRKTVSIPTYTEKEQSKICSIPRINKDSNRRFLQDKKMVSTYYHKLYGFKLPNSNAKTRIL